MTQPLFSIAQASPPAGGGSSLTMFLPMVLIVGVMYVLVIMPQQKKQKAHQRMLSEIKKGDDVVTQGGIIGQVTGIKDDEMTLQVQEGVRLRVRRSAVLEKLGGAAAGEKKAS